MIRPIRRPDVPNPCPFSFILILRCRRLYQHWTAKYGETQLHFRAVLDVLFPGYDKAFQKVCNRTSLELLSRFPTPAELLAADREKVLNCSLATVKAKFGTKQSYCSCSRSLDTAYPIFMELKLKR